MYAFGIGTTAACGAIYLVLRGLVLLIGAWPADVMPQHYLCFYVSVLSALLVPPLLRPLPVPPHRRHHHPCAGEIRWSRARV